MKGITALGYLQAECIEEAVFPNALQQLKEHCKGDYITFVDCRDKVSKQYYKICNEAIVAHKAMIAFSNKTLREKVVDPFTRSGTQENYLVDLEKEGDLFPISLLGTFLAKELFCKYEVESLSQFEWEKEFLMHLLLENRRILFIGEAEYHYNTPIEFNIRGFLGNKEEGWYTKYRSDFLLPLLKETKAKYKEVPEFLQCFAMYLVDVRIQAIRKSRNEKYLDAVKYAGECKEIFSYINQDIYYNKYDLAAYMPNLATKKVYYKNDYAKFVTVLFFPSISKKENETTLKQIVEQSLGYENIQLIICNTDTQLKKEEFDDSLIKHGQYEYREYGDLSRYEICEIEKSNIVGEYVTFIQGGDEIGLGYLTKLYSYMIKCYGGEQIVVGMARKYYNVNGELKLDPASCRRLGFNNHDGRIDLDQEYSCFPHFFLGTVFRSTTFLENPIVDRGMESEKLYLMDLLLRERKIAYVGRAVYSYCEPVDGDFFNYPGIYLKEWYYDAMFLQIAKFLEDARLRYDQIPTFLQYYSMYLVKCRFDAGFNNRNKHIVPVKESYDYIMRYHEILKDIDVDVILNIHNTAIYNANPNLKAIFVKLKYNNVGLDLDLYYDRENVITGYDKQVITSLQAQKLNIKFIDYVHGNLEFDGTLSYLFGPERFRYYVSFNGKQYDFTYNEMYSHTKFFGMPVYKGVSFHVSVPIEKVTESQKLYFMAEQQNKCWKLGLTFQSHTSRLTNYFANAYWKFGNYVAMMEKGNITIAPADEKELKKREKALLAEMKASSIPGAKELVRRRRLYHLAKPFFKNKKIWMFYDKIYKGGDSSEYLYKYAQTKKDGIIKYYLLDENCVDYKRLKKEGYRPLKRGSLKHRLVFLYADMMIISNSTVFAFNDYTLETSSFIKDLADFHVVCVQHGLSVQKIAIAQNRLRDNTRLYFCASKYEVQNLSRPVYGYNGYDAIKLTGVPRYDGLISDEKKQILLSPTWRMQSARPVTKNEGVERDYNEEFKSTAYFKVYNSLINDPRLLEAAKEYGYKILYVLHPIVSPQARDFDTNEQVEIVPATSEMSYEKIFCESSLMVTDFSGVQFDFAYMKKPLVYLHHDAIPQHYEEGTYHYDTMAFGEIAHNNEELIDYLCEYMKTGCKMKENYVKRVDDFYAFHDQDNCKRIYDEMMVYQERVIDKSRNRTV